MLSYTDFLESLPKRESLYFYRGITYSGGGNSGNNNNNSGGGGGGYGYCGGGNGPREGL